MMYTTWMRALRVSEHSELNEYKDAVESLNRLIEKMAFLCPFAADNHAGTFFSCIAGPSGCLIEGALL